MSGQKYCPWGATPGHSEPCAKDECALWLESACAFVWIAKWAQDQLLEIERQEYLAMVRSKLQGE
jgi:hypothetical protein